MAAEVDAIAETLVAALRAQAGAMRVAGIEVRLGAMVDLAPAVLQAALEATLGPGVEVQITVVAAVLRCLDCGAEYPGDEHPCPACGSGRAELIHGTELEIARAWGAAGA